MPGVPTPPGYNRPKPDPVPHPDLPTLKKFSLQSLSVTATATASAVSWLTRTTRKSRRSALLDVSAEEKLERIEKAFKALKKHIRGRIQAGYVSPHYNLTAYDGNDITAVAHVPGVATRDAVVRLLDECEEAFKLPITPGTVACGFLGRGGWCNLDKYHEGDHHFEGFHK